MPEELVIADFSGGMNASVAVDKLAKNECLLAENCRFDEAGNVLITGANTIQGTYGTSGFHSLFIDPVLGAIGGAGSNVYVGQDFTSLTLSTTTNSNGSKMSFGPANNRIYMDLSGVGYWGAVGSKQLITVDWVPPAAAGGITGPNLVSTGSTTGTQGYAWTNPANIASASVYASVVLDTDTSTSANLLGLNPAFALGTASVIGVQVNVDYNLSLDHGKTTQAFIYATLVVNGVPTGATKTANVASGAGSKQFGNSTDLWSIPGLTPAQVNAANFGIQFSVIVTVSNGGPVTFSLKNAVFRVNQAAVGMVAANGAAGTLSGAYTWKVAFVGPNGEESEASVPTSTVTLTNQAGTLTAIPTGDARTTGRNIYRKGVQLSSFYLVATIGDNSSTTYSDNMTDLAALTQGLILAGDTVGDEPNTRLGNQSVKYPTFHYDRVFWASGNLLIWSKPLNGFAYPANFSVPVGDGKAITGIFSMGGELFIFKPDAIYRFSGTDENSFLLSKTLSPVGTDWPFTAVLCGGAQSGFSFSGRIIFSNSRGIWAFNGYTSNKITPKLDLWFRQDNRTGISLFGQTGFNPPEIVNASVTANFSAAANPTFYYLVYTEASQFGGQSSLLVLDLERGNITKRSIALYGITVDSVQGYFYGGGLPGRIFKLDDWNAIDSGSGTVNFDFQDKYRDMNLRGSRFALFGLEFMIKTNGNTVTPTVYFDEGTANESLGTISPSGTVPSRVFRKLASANSRYCRNFSIRLNSAAGAANSSGIPNIEVVHIKVYFEPLGARARTGEAP